MGSVAERLLHSSPVPLLLAPQGYSSGAGRRVRPADLRLRRHRAVHARRCTPSCALAARFDLGVRVATFVPRAETMYPPEVGFDAEDMVAAQAAEQAVGLHDEAAGHRQARRGVGDVETVVARGTRLGRRAERDPAGPTGDVLVFGSSRLGQLARVFLGSTASKILRHTPVPALVDPERTAHWTDL